MNALQLADAIDEMAVNPKGGKMAAIAYRKCADLIRKKLCEPCTYCGPGKFTGLPGNACENCMNTGYLVRNTTTDSGQEEELRMLRERLGPRGLEVVMIDGAGHYVNEKVKSEIERLRSALFHEEKQP